MSNSEVAFRRGALAAELVTHHLCLARAQRLSIVVIMYQIGQWREREFHDKHACIADANYERAMRR